jgi:hypothetical protein
MYSIENMYNAFNTYQYPNFTNIPMNNMDFINQFPDHDQYFPYADKGKDGNSIRLMDYGPEPFVVDIEKVTKQNNTFRTVLWTGNYLQLALTSINIWEDIGLEMHDLHFGLSSVSKALSLKSLTDRIFNWLGIAT